MKEDFCNKKIIIKDPDEPFAKAIAQKIRIDISCAVTVVKNLQEFERAMEQESFFLAIVKFSDDCDSDLEAISMASQNSLPVVALVDAIGDDAKDTLLFSKNIVNYVLKHNKTDIEFLIRLISQLAKNSEIEVLAVDDSSLYRKNFENILKNQLFKTHIAKDGEEALELVKANHNIKLVLTDYRMPKIDGFELVLRLRDFKKKDELAIIAVSSDSSDSIVAKFLKFGANDYVKKPFSKEELVCRVNNNVEYIALIELQKKLMNFDFLTGLYNRKFLVESGKTLHANAVRGNINFVVGMMDLDDFKKVNDAYGHDVGDLVIKDFAQLLKKSFRKSDIVCRFGGEEFCVLLTNVGDACVASTFEKALDEVRKKEIILPDGRVVKYTVSVGVCQTLEDGFESMIKVADEKLYEAKKAGKDRVVV